MGDEIYEEVLKKYGKWLERVGNGFFIRCRIDMDGEDIVSDTILRTVPTVLERNSDPKDEDWRKSLYTVAINLMRDIRRGNNAQKRIPKDKISSLDEEHGNIQQ